jgi:uncharacterized UBP type Zn finger protein
MNLPDYFQNVIPWDFDPGEKACEHIHQVQNVQPGAQGCEECLKSGDRWVNLRMCLICGHVGCCDSSKNRHATRHYNNTRHPLVRSFLSEDHWVWCYIDQQLME